MAECIGTGLPQFSCALVQMRYRIGDNGCGKILKKVTSGEKTAIEKGLKKNKEGGKWGGDVNKAIVI